MAGKPSNPAYKKKMGYPDASTTNPENPPIIFAGSVISELNKAYCVAVYAVLVKPDKYAIKAEVANPSLRFLVFS